MNQIKFAFQVFFAAFIPAIVFSAQAQAQAVKSFAGSSKTEVGDRMIVERWIVEAARAEIDQRAKFYGDLWTKEMKPEFFDKSYKTLSKKITKSISRDGAQKARFERLVKEAADATGWTAEIRAILFDSDKIEAFNLDGLFIVGSTELLKFSDDEILTILLHETAHNLFPEERLKPTSQLEYKCDAAAVLNLAKLGKDVSLAETTLKKVSEHPKTDKFFDDYPSWESRIRLAEFAGVKFTETAGK